MARSPSPYGRSGHRSRSSSPASRRRRDRGHDHSPTRGYGHQTSQSSLSEPQCDPFIKALNNKDRRGRQGRERDGPLQVYIRAGKMIPRIVNPWLNIQQVFTTGLSSDGHMQIERLSDAPENDTEASELQILKERELSAYKKILKIMPSMPSTITRLCKMSQGLDEGIYDGLLFKFIDLLHDSSNQARIADTAKVNRAMCQLMVEKVGGHLTPPVPNEKCTRGWAHIDTGRFNCPARFIKDYDESFLAELKAGEILVTADDFPFFMYDPDLMDEDDICAGLCRGFLLMRTVEEMFFGNGKPLIVTHTARDPIAVKFGITSITPEIIAYGACQARFNLSAVSEWPMQDMMFNLQQFYYNVLFLFEEQDDEWATETLAHWNKHFFPQGRSCNARKQRAIPPTSSNSDVSKLREARARQRQLALSQATS